MRRLKAQMILKDLSLGQLAKLSGVPYVVASMILNGHYNHAEHLRRIKKAIREAPTPEETAA